MTERIMKAQYGWIALALALDAGLLCSCGTRSSQTVMAGRASAPREAEAQAAPGGSGQAALRPDSSEERGSGAEVSYAEGKAETRGEGGDWVAVEIGDLIPNGNMVRTGSLSSCILKFGALGAVRIGPDSLASVNSLRSGARTGAVAVNLKVGSVVCKVRKLVSKDSFEVKTEVAVLGVRGTEFMVEVPSDGKSIHVAVADGAVSVLPQSFGSIKLQVDSEAKPGEGNLPLEVSETLSNVSPVVAAGHEARIALKEMAKVNEAYTRLIEKAKVTSQAEAGTEGSASSISISDLTRGVISRIDSLDLKPVPLSPAAKTSLSEIHSVKLDSPQADPAKEAEPSGDSSLGTSEKAAVSAPQVEMRTLSVETLPANAAISLQGHYVSSGVYTARLDRSKSFTLTVSSAGYETSTCTVEAGPGDESVKIALVPLHVSFTLESEPSGCNVFVGERLLGATPCLVSGDYGQTVSLRLEKAGYKALATKIELDSPMQEKIGVCLDPIPVRMKVNAIPTTASISVDDTPSGVGQCVFSRLAGTEVRLGVSAPGYAPEERRFAVGNADAELSVRLASLREMARSKVSSSSIMALAWFGGSVLCADGSGALYAVRLDPDYRIVNSWSLQTRNGAMSQYELLVREDRLAFAGSAEWLVLEPGTGKILEREAVAGEAASITGRPGLFMGKAELRPRSNGLSIRQGESRKELSFPGGSLMYPVAYGNRAILADSFGTVYFVDPESCTIDGKIGTKVSQPFETGILVDGNRGYFVGRRGDVACVDLDKRSLVWQKKIDASSSSGFLYDIQDAGSLIGLYARGRLYLLSKANGEPAGGVIGNLSARPYVDARRVYAPTVAGEILEYSLPGASVTRSLKIGAPITSILAIPEPLPSLAIGLKDGTLLLYNPEGEK
jgi:hypothetical protein